LFCICLYLVIIALHDRALRCTELALLEDRHYIAYIVLVLISNYFFWLQMFTARLVAIWVYSLSPLVGDLGHLILIILVEIVHAILLVSLAIFRAKNAAP
jgi:hypothetical protein